MDKKNNGVSGKTMTIKQKKLIFKKTTYYR